MKLFICDYHLEAGLLCRAEGKEKAAKEHSLAAKELIDQTGYHCRDGEVER
jgi:hypothetical protein